MKEFILKEHPHPEGRFKVNYREQLNPAQYEAVATLEGPLLVIAGAGSGKTRTLIYRVARLVESGIPPESILLLTFTRRAASEMLKRAAAMSDFRCRRVSGGTFHSFGARILRRHSARVGYLSNFVILDRSDAEDVIDLLRAKIIPDRQEKRFPRKKTLCSIYSRSINMSRSVDEVVNEEYLHFTNHLSTFKDLFSQYVKYKKDHMLMDYDDLLLYMKKLLEENPDVRTALGSEYKFIMVDEFQDTNKVQADILRLLAKEHSNIMVVGDDSQSIYSFRGANFRNIMDFPEQFPGTRVIKLEENYRSTQHILDFTNFIIEQAKEKYVKKLFTRKKEGNRPVLLQAATENEQSRFVCQKVLEMREQGVELNDIAVLFRAGFHSFDLEIELAAANIPYIKYGGFKFIETAHIKDVLSFLRVMVNPRDRVAWMRVLQLLPQVGPQTANRVIDFIEEGTDSIDALKKVVLPARAAKSVRDLARLLEKAAPDSLELSSKVEIIRKFYQRFLEKKYDDYPKRIMDLEHFQNITQRYRSIEQLLTDIILEPPNASIGDVAATDLENEHLILSTIHSAKGLEWNTVFIIWALEGYFPSFYAYKRDKELEEERRLMYVAATRACENLFISYPINIYDRNAGNILTKPSRFVAEAPPNLLDPMVIVPQEN